MTQLLEVQAGVVLVTTIHRARRQHNQQVHLVVMEIMAAMVIIVRMLVEVVVVLVLLEQLACLSLVMVGTAFNMIYLELIVIMLVVVVLDQILLDLVELGVWVGAEMVEQLYMLAILEQRIRVVGVGVAVVIVKMAVMAAPAL
ncbi:MAG: hypothetical protein PHW60_01180 [Kiritimatiellae bacterium]|nr:hypothetical protein [Kiritimatiellia bacterium]